MFVGVNVERHVLESHVDDTRRNIGLGGHIRERELGDILPLVSDRHHRMQSRDIDGERERELESCQGSIAPTGWAPCSVLCEA